jgi:hypothetical protein
MTKLNEIRRSNIVLESRQSRLVFAPLERGGYGLGLDVRDGETWRSICAPINPLVRGPSFNLLPSTLEVRPDGTLLARGTARATTQMGAPLEYAFETSIRAHAHGWFELDTTLELPEALELQMRGPTTGAITSGSRRASRTRPSGTTKPTATTARPCTTSTRTRVTN